MTEYTITLKTYTYNDKLEPIEGYQRFICYYLAEVQNLLSCMISSADGILHIDIDQREIEEANE